MMSVLRLGASFQIAIVKRCLIILFKKILLDFSAFLSKPEYPGVQISCFSDIQIDFFLDYGIWFYNTQGSTEFSLHSLESFPTPTFSPP